MRARSLLIVTGVLLAFVADATVKADAQPTKIQCVPAGCFVPMAELERLVAKAEAAEDYAAMCGWGGAKKP